ncbi:MAG: hypothetical protein JO010_08125, partial [Alphaproteobacteria bacterium]|nr:hypothetical protein [Alphaproteobacteria bacterium]
MSDTAQPAESFDERAARVMGRLQDDGDGAAEGTGEATGGAPEAAGAKAQPEAAGAADEEGEGAIAPPVSWPAEEKESFRKLPRELQAVIAKREGERERLVAQRAQQAAQRERALDEQRRGYAQRLDAFLAQAQAGDPLHGAASPEEMARLARENPAAFAQRLAALQQRGQQLAAAQQERRRIAEDNNRDYFARELKQLQEKLPEFREETQRQALLAELGSYLAEAGFSQQELSGVADHRTYLVALDAMRYRKLMKAQKDAAGKKVVAPAAKVQKPGAAADGEPAGGKLAKLKKAA